MAASVKHQVLYTCRKCGTVFSHRSSLYYHQINAHSETSNCRIRGKTVGVGSSLTNHVRAHSQSITRSAAWQGQKKEPIKCNKCRRAFANKEALCHHYKTHSSDYKITSRQCEDEHRKPQNFQCHICEKRFATNAARLSHERWHKIKCVQTVPEGVVAIKAGEGYKCLTRGSSFTNKCNAEKHAKDQHSKDESITSLKTLALSSRDTENTYKCMECLTVFISKVGLQHHILIHSGLKKYKCRKCGMGFTRAYRLRKHVECHVKGIYKCTMCSASFSIPKDLALHLKMHNDPNNGCVTCKYCKFLFFDEVILKRHIKARHTSKLQFKCNICTAQFKQAAHLRQHVEIHDQQLKSMPKKAWIGKCHRSDGNKVNVTGINDLQESPKNKLHCAECNLDLKSNHQFQCHSVKHTVVPQRTKQKESVADTSAVESVIKCMECMVVYSDLTVLKRHVLSHSGVKRHECEDCGIRFRRKDQLKNHVRYHQIKGQFRCGQCTASYTTVASLVLHLQRHKDPSYGCVTCMHCKFEFFTHKILQRHLEVRHTRKLAIECNICSAQFSKKIHLKQHNAIHDEQLKFAAEKSQSNENLQIKLDTVADKRAQTKRLSYGSKTAAQNGYECAECLMILSKTSSWKRHILSHSGLKLYECSECGLGFSKKFSLQSHEIVHQKKEAYRCDLCTASYTSSNLLNVHKNMHQDSNFGLVACKHCKFLFLNKAVLERHILARHTKKLRTECSVCRAQFEKDEHLHHHLEIHTQQLKTLNCNEQDKPLPVNLNESSTHPLEEPKLIDCDICSESFAHLSALKYHMQNSHNKTLCATCYLFFDNRFLSLALNQCNEYVCCSCNPSTLKKRGQPPGIPVACRLDNVSTTQLVLALLRKLVDEDVFGSEGLVGKPVDVILETIVELCGQTPVKDDVYSAEECMVENLKLLFALSVGEAATSTLLQFKPVKDILCSILTPFYMV